ncbi:MAG: FeoA family protein, partial [bacterium]
METRFSNLEPGDTGNVVGFTEGSASYRSKLLAMGARPGRPFPCGPQSPVGGSYRN